MRRVDVTGQRFHRLIVLGDSGRKGRSRYILVLCDCGTKKSVHLGHLRDGNIRSCGCLLVEKNKSRSTHGNATKGSPTSTYRIWQDMKKRCENKNHKHYSNYGGRGVAVCDRWHDFSNFLSDMGERPSDDLSIDRYPDTNGNYEPGNCRWATMLEQANNRRTTPMVLYQGRTQSIADWARELGFAYYTLRKRLTDYGWSVERAFTTPAILGRNQFG